MKVLVDVNVKELVIGSAEIEKWGTSVQYEVDLEESLQDEVQVAIEGVLNDWGLRDADEDNVHVTVYIDSEEGP